MQYDARCSPLRGAQLGPCEMVRAPKYREGGFGDSNPGNREEVILVQNSVNMSVRLHRKCGIAAYYLQMVSECSSAHGLTVWQRRLDRLSRRKTQKRLTCNMVHCLHSGCCCRRWCCGRLVRRSGGRRLGEALEIWHSPYAVSWNDS